MKRKVQAQRKFAQGAFIPPSAPSANFTERRAIDPPNDKGVNVFNSNTSAKKILDVISFSHPGMHVHSPIVLLERLSTKNYKSPSTNVTQAMQSSDTEDDQPLAYHSKRKIKTRRGNNMHKSRQRRGPRRIVKKNIGTMKRKRTSVKEANCGRPRIITRNCRSILENVGRSGIITRNRASIRSGSEREDMEVGGQNINVAGTSTDDKAVMEIVAQNNLAATSTAVNNEREDMEVGGQNINVAGTSTDDKAIKEIVAQKDIAQNNFAGTSTAVNNDNCTSSMPFFMEVITKVEDIISRPPSSVFLEDDGLKLEDNVGSDVSSIDSVGEPSSTSVGFSQINEQRQEVVTENQSVTEIKTEWITVIENPAITGSSNPSAAAIQNLSVTGIGLSREVIQNPSVADIESTSSSATGNISGPDNASTAGTRNASAGVIRKAPVFYPTEAEFNDPLAYYEKIRPEAAKFGLCKVIAPESFKPSCDLSKLDRISVTHQYINRLFNRWGEATRDLCSIRTYLATYNVLFSRPPLINGLEIDLPKMFKIVQKYGGFRVVSRKKKWARIAEEMNLTNLINPLKKLDQLYVKYLLPYDILSNRERDTLKTKIEGKWQKAYTKMLRRANNPLHLKKVIIGESDPSSEEEEPVAEDEHMANSVSEAEDCTKSGRTLKLTTYKKINKNAVKMHFPTEEPTVENVEKFYWEAVLCSTDHVSVYSASVDTSTAGHGFTTDPNDPMSQHGWNLKNVLNNEDNVLRSLGAVVSVTAPILHLNMILTTTCWFRDPHGLPWMEYLHQGKNKIWYGIPDEESDKFRRAVERLCPALVQNKSIWMPSDISMVPPNLLLSEGVTLTRTIQKPGEYVFIFPQAYSSSICCGFSISESVYFAKQPWLLKMRKIFQELRESFEPMFFALEQLLIALCSDSRLPLSVLQQVYPDLVSVINEELNARFTLVELGVVEEFIGRQPQVRAWNVTDEDECEVCRRLLFLSKVKSYHNNVIRKTCPQHARLILEKNDPNESVLALQTLVSNEELRTLLNNTQQKILNLNIADDD